MRYESVTSTLRIRVLCLCVVAVSAAGCRAAQPEFRPVATIRDLMTAVVDPAADAVWQAVRTTVTADGVDERMPRTDEEWAEVRRHALHLVEGSNLLLMSGRQVARPGEKSAYPGIELEPGEIQVLLDRDPEAWAMLAHGLHEAAMGALKAIDLKDAEGVLAAGSEIQVACENCHARYWYPNAPAPPAPPSP